MNDLVLPLHISSNAINMHIFKKNYLVDRKGYQTIQTILLMQYKIKFPAPRVLPLECEGLIYDCTVWHSENKQKTNSLKFHARVDQKFDKTKCQNTHGF